MKSKFLNKYMNMPIAARAAMWFMVCSLLTKGISFITTPIFTRLLTKEQYGLFTIYTSWLQIITIFSTFRLDYSVFNKGMSKYPDNRDEYASVMLGLTTVINSVLLIIYLIFHQAINSFTELSTVVVLCIFIRLYFIPAVNFWSLRQRYEFKYRIVVLVTILSAVSNTFIGILAVSLSENKGLARIFSSVLVEVAFGLAIYSFVMIKGRKFWNTEYIKFAIIFNFPLIPHYFSSYIVDQSDKIMIQKLLGFGSAALYSVAYTVGGLVKIIISAASNTLIPLQYRLLEAKQYKNLNRQIVGVMIGTSYMIVCLAIVAPEIVLILGGKEYMPAIYVMPPVISSVYFSFLYTLLANVEFFFDKNKFAMKISMIGALVNVGLNYLLIPYFGFVAAAYTTLICYVIYAIGHMAYVDKISKIKVHEGIFEMTKLIYLGIVTTILSVSASFLYELDIIRYILLLILLMLAFSRYKKVLDFVKQMK